MAAFLGSYLLPVAAAGASYAAQRDVEARQKRIIDQMNAFQTEKAKKGEASVEKFLQKITPEQRAVDSAQVRDELSQGLDKSVGAAAAFEKPDNFAGKVSQGYRDRLASNEGSVKARLEKAMKELAIIGTPAESNLRTQFRFGDAASDVDATNAAINRSTPIYHQAIANQRPHQFLTLLSQVMSGAGSANAGGGTRL
jgi:hypothetical protein